MKDSSRRKPARRDYGAIYQQVTRDGRLCPDKTDVDALYDYRPLSGDSIALYDVALDPWNAYVQQRRTRNPNENPTPRDLETLKHYIKFLALSMKGRQAEENPHRLPTALSVRCVARRFISAYNREHRDEEPMKQSMAAYITGQLTNELGLPHGKRARRHKKFFTAESYKKLQGFAWSGDWHVSIHDGMVADNTNVLNTHCYTSARRKEVCGLQYKDLEFQIGWCNGKPDLKLKIPRLCKGQEFEENKYLPLIHFVKKVKFTNELNLSVEHAFSERWDVPDQDYPALVAQPIVHWVANFLSVGALAGIQTLDQLLELRPPPGCSFREIQFADHVLDKPVFPIWCASGMTDKPRHRESLGRDLDNWAKRSGHTDGLGGLHSVRREALFKVNNAGYSIASTLQFASQKSMGVLKEHYLGSLSSVDGAATYHKLPPRTDLHEDFHSATMRYNPALEHTLSAEEKQNIEASDEYISYSKEINDLSRKATHATEADNVDHLHHTRQLLYRRRNDLFETALRKKQKAQKLDYETKHFYENKDWHRGHFDRFEHMLTEARRRLSQLMRMSAAPRSDLWRQATKDLMELRCSDCSVAYQECLRPSGHGCPVDGCDIKVATLPANDRWLHIFSCHESMLLRQHGYAQFCFTCSSWFSESVTWEAHCETHVNERKVPVRYNPVKYRTATACAGHCPVCIWQKTDRAASKRFHQFTDRAVWRRHISSCICEFIITQTGGTNFACPDLRCPLTFTSQNDLWHHLQDVHSIPTPSEGDLAKLDAKRRNLPPQDQLKVRFVKLDPYTTSYPDPDDAFCFTGESGEESLREDTSGLFSESRHISLTPPSELFFESSDGTNAYPSPGEDNDALALGDKSIGRDPPVDPILLETETVPEAGLSPCLRSSMPALEELSMSGAALTSAEDRMSLDESSTLPDDQFQVDRLLGKWQHRRKVYYYLRWETGEHSFEPEENICEDMRKDFGRRDFTGFHEGVRIMKWTKVRNGEAWYLVAFKGCTEKWELPDTALHPDLTRPSKPAVPRKAKGRRPRSKCV